MSESAGVPAYLLIGSGIINGIYSFLYFLWSAAVIGLPFTGAVGSIMDGSNGVVEGFIAFAILAAVPLLQMAGFAITGFLGLITIFGGVRLNSYRSKGVIWLGILFSTLAPIIGLFVNAGSMFNLTALGMGCITGCLLGSIPAGLLLVFGWVASIVAAMHAASEVAAERFEEAA